MIYNGFILGCLGQKVIDWTIDTDDIIVSYPNRFSNGRKVKKFRLKKETDEYFVFKEFSYGLNLKLYKNELFAKKALLNSEKDDLESKKKEVKRLQKEIEKIEKCVKK